MRALHSEVKKAPGFFPIFWIHIINQYATTKRYQVVVEPELFNILQGLEIVELADPVGGQIDGGQAAVLLQILQNFDAVVWDVQLLKARKFFHVFNLKKNSKVWNINI